MVADPVEVEAVVAALTWFTYTDVAGLDRDGIRTELDLVARMRALLDVKHARLTRQAQSLAAASPSMFPEADIAAASKSTRSEADKAAKRASTLGEVPELEEALAEGGISAGHVDVFARAMQRLKPGQRELLAADGERLAAIAARSTPEEFDRVLRREIARLDRREGEDRLGRQKRANRLRWWTDPVSGMLCMRAEFDPETGLLLMGRIEATVEAMFHGGVPEDSPTGESRQDYLRALAMAALINRRQQQREPPTPAADKADPVAADHATADDASADPTGSEPVAGDGAKASGPTRSGPFWEGDLVHAGDRAEVIVVIDLETLLNGLHENSIIDNGHGVDLPVESYRRLACQAAIIPVVLDGAGVALDEGRQRRLATRSQRRALRAMYATCAVPGCRVKVRHCEPHHLTFWTPPHRGPTDLDNLLPVCSRHHHALHEGGWRIAMHPDRSLTITYPDGTIQTTGPPGRQRAA